MIGEDGGIQWGALLSYNFALSLLIVTTNVVVLCEYLPQEFPLWGTIKGYCIVLYCIVLYCIVLYCIVLYCIVCIVLYCTVLCTAFMENGKTAFTKNLFCRHLTHFVNMGHTHIYIIVTCSNEMSHMSANLISRKRYINIAW